MKVEEPFGNDCRILIVDDDPTIRLLACEALEQAGFSVAQTGDGARVLALFEQVRPDMILLDVQLPGVDGFGICRQIREHPEGENVPIIMMTGFDDIESINRAYETGATDFISKPLNWVLLCHRVRYMLRASRMFQSLNESEGRLNHAQMIARIGSWEWDMVSDRLNWSASAHEIFGLDGSGFAEAYLVFLNSILSAGNDSDRPAPDALQFKERSYHADHSIHLLDGRECYVHSEAEVVLDKDGRPVSLIGIVQDITERKQAEIYGEINRKILQILNEPGSLQDSIQRLLATLKDRTGFDAVGLRLQDRDDFPYVAQKGFSRSFLLTENTLVERAADEGVCRDKDGNTSLECTCGLVLSGGVEPGNPLFSPGGSFWVNDSKGLLEIPPGQDPRHRPRNRCIYEGYASMALVPIRNKDRIVGLIQCNDQRKGCFTEHVIELLEGIASHIGEAMLRKQAEEELQKKDAEIEQFIYTVSHDLRSPLVTVKTFMGYLEKDMADGNQERLAQDIQFIHSAADKMKLMLDELLELSCVGRVETHPVRVSFAEVVGEALAVLAGVISERKVEIHFGDMDLMMFGDRPQLCKIWQNLIENAVKYSPADSIPRIELGVRLLNGERVFFVKDHGIGIDPQYQTKIFGIFEKLDPKSSGVGIGLPMIQRIVENLGGRIWVESAGSGKGACFFFTLPNVVGSSLSL